MKPLTNVQKKFTFQTQKTVILDFSETNPNLSENQKTSFPVDSSKPRNSIKSERKKSHDSVSICASQTETLSQTSESSIFLPYIHINSDKICTSEAPKVEKENDDIPFFSGIEEYFRKLMPEKFIDYTHTKNYLNKKECQDKYTKNQMKRNIRIQNLNTNAQNFYFTNCFCYPMIYVYPNKNFQENLNMKNKQQSDNDRDEQIKLNQKEKVDSKNDDEDQKKEEEEILKEKEESNEDKEKNENESWINSKDCHKYRNNYYYDKYDNNYYFKKTNKAYLYKKAYYNNNRREYNQFFYRNYETNYSLSYNDNGFNKTERQNYYYNSNRKRRNQKMIPNKYHFYK